MYNRTIGERLKAERDRLWLTLDEVSNATRINRKFLEAIENNSFETFSSHTQAIGFIKNYAKHLSIDSENLVAIYKRDFEAEKKTRKITKLDDEEFEKIKKKNSISSLKQIQITSKGIWLGTSLVLILVFVLLTISFVRNAFAPPVFSINSPTELKPGENKEFSTSLKTLKIKGETQGYTLIKINEIPLILSSGFNFESEELPITSESTKFVIKAESQLGVKSESTLTIIREDIVKQNSKKSIQISSNKSGVFLQAKADNTIQYNDLTVDGAVINVSALTDLVIETDDYKAISIIYKDMRIPLTKNSSKYVFNSEGELVLE